MNKKSEQNWVEFRENGFLWLTNTILHIFGWSIVFEIENNKIVNVYPSRTKFRGYYKHKNDIGYELITRYMNDNSKELLNDFSD